MTIFSVQKILFDLDGTLVDTAPDLHAATNHTLQTIGRDAVPIEAVRHMTGFGAVKLIETALATTGGFDGHNFDELRDVFLDYYRQNICVHSQVYPGGTEMLDSLTATGFSLAICTNKPIDLALPLLEKLKLRHYFDAVTGGDSFAFKKPDPRHLIQTAAQLPGDGNALMVGDSSPDIKGAQAANIPVIAVSYGYADQPINTLVPAPSAVINSLSDLSVLVTRASA